LLNRLNDDSFGKFYIPVGKFLILIFYINIPAFAVFCYWEYLDLLSLSTLVFLFLSTVPILASCSLVMSAIFDISSQFQWNMKKKIQACENKRIREVWYRELQSCQVVRCQIGNFYHMEGKAKLTLVDTMVNGFVFMVVQRNLN
jgi:hypothetical protein